MAALIQIGLVFFYNVVRIPPRQDQDVVGLALVHRLGRIHRDVMARAEGVLLGEVVVDNEIKLVGEIKMINHRSQANCRAVVRNGLVL